MTPDNLAEFRALAEKITPGPWVTYNSLDGAIYIRSPDMPNYRPMAISILVGPNTINAAFIAFAGTHAKALLARIDALEADNARYREALERLARLGNGDHYGNSDGNMIARAALKGHNQ